MTLGARLDSTVDMLAHRSHDTSLIGIGLYTPSDAQHLTGISSGKLVRWLRGHSVGPKQYEPLWRRQIVTAGDETVLGFQDLIQARVVAALVREGLSAQKVRRAIALAEAILASDHPFANARFRTDGSTLLIQSLTPGEDDRLIDLFQGGQYVMRTVIEPSLRGIEFEGGLAARWWPEGEAKRIVLDPQRQFGQPIEDRTGVPTRVLARAVDAEGSIERAAAVFSVPTSAVRRALAFEKRLAA